MSDDSEIKYVVFSQDAADMFGYKLYLLTDYQEVIGTAIYTKSTLHRYEWMDKQIVGEYLKYLGDIPNSSNRFAYEERKKPFVSKFGFKEQ